MKVGIPFLTHFFPLFPTSIVMKKLNKMTIVLDFPVLRLSKVKQNLFYLLIEKNTQ